MAVTINIPSQVKTYANLAAFPASGSLKTIYIAEDTNKTYRWTGSVYVEISASAAMTWGQIGGTLSNQTDLQNALDAKVPTSRTLTINGVTQDLSADRTFTIATGLTVGTTPIASGTIGRVLFQGTGNVLQQSSSLFWDGTNNRLGIGTSTPANPLDVVGSARTLGTSQIRSSSGSVLGSNLTTTAAAIFYNNGFSGVVGVGSYANSGGEIQSAQNGGLSVGGFLTLQRQGGNVLIGTATDAGYKLDVNGTSRITGLAYQTGYSYSVQRLQFNQGVSTTNVGYINGISNGVIRLNNASETDFTRLQFGGGTTAFPSLQRSGSALAIMDATGTSLSNLLIGTATDVASSKLTIESTTQGFLPPRMTTTQKNAIASPATGLQVYDTTLNQMSYYNGTTWTNI